MSRGDLTEHVAEVGGQRKVASFVELIALQTRPASVNFSTTHTVAHHKHRIRVTVVRTTISILSHRPAKLRHRQHNHGVHTLAQVLVKRRDSRAELLQQIRELTTRIALVHMRVPTTNFSKGNLQTNAGFDQLCDL